MPTQTNRPTILIRCPDCGEVTEFDPRRYRGMDTTIDGEMVFVCPVCAKRVWIIGVDRTGLYFEDRGRP